MTRRGQSKLQRLRRARKEVEQHLGRNQGEYVRPPRSDCVEKVFYVPANDANSARIESRTWRKGKHVVDFHLTLEVRSWDTWTWNKVLRIDICHGHAHAHRIVDGQDVEEDPEHVHRIDVRADVEAAYTDATRHCVSVAAGMVRGEGGHDEY